MKPEEPRESRKTVKNNEYLNILSKSGDEILGVKYESSNPFFNFEDEQLCRACEPGKILGADSPESAIDNEPEEGEILNPDGCFNLRKPNGMDTVTRGGCTDITNSEQRSSIEGSKSPPGLLTEWKATLGKMRNVKKKKKKHRKVDTANNGNLRVYIDGVRVSEKIPAAAGSSRSCASSLSVMPLPRISGKSRKKNKFSSNFGDRAIPRISLNEQDSLQNATSSKTPPKKKHQPLNACSVLEDVFGEPKIGDSPDIPSQQEAPQLNNFLKSLSGVGLRSDSKKSSDKAAETAGPSNDDLNPKESSDPSDDTSEPKRSESPDIEEVPYIPEPVVCIDLDDYLEPGEEWPFESTKSKEAKIGKVRSKLSEAEKKLLKKDIIYLDTKMDSSESEDENKPSTSRRNRSLVEKSRNILSDTIVLSDSDSDDSVQPSDPVKETQKRNKHRRSKDEIPLQHTVQFKQPKQNHISELKRTLFQQNLTVQRPVMMPNLLLQRPALVPNQVQRLALLPNLVQRPPLIPNVPVNLGNQGLFLHQLPCLNPLRPIAIDGSNVAFSHGKNQVFSVRGIVLAVQLFQRRGHTVKVFLPMFREGVTQEFLQRDVVVYTPSRCINGNDITSYDDRFIIEYAFNSGAVVLSNDRYGDLLRENSNWEKVIRHRVLMFSFVDDMLILPVDPFGRRGITLEQLLRF